MPGIVIVGAQWGDEGKGKVTDLLAEQAQVVVRYQGGNNAGHTVVVGQQTLKLHLIPSGIHRPGVLCVIGNGLVIDPRALVAEMDELEANGLDTSGLRISANAHLVMPYHLMLDGIEEERRGGKSLGTTRRGIGPTYTDKAARYGLRVQDLLDMAVFEEKLGRALEQKNALLTAVYGKESLEMGPILEEYGACAQRLRPHIVDASLLVHKALTRGQNVLFEGAQGTLLDVDHGTYPFVTSSSPVAGGACTGVGVGPRQIDGVIGVSKAYTTRVGAGPFPTELTDAVGDHLLEVGREYGTTTGRPRRCGWFDGVILRYAARVNGLTGLALTKLDVLTGLPSLKICVSYEYDGQVLNEFPYQGAILARCQPIYEEMDGWTEEISGARAYDELPSQARAYVARLEELAGVPIDIISVGPGREQTILVRSPCATQQ
ncbi:MAG: adenylosuccinate synthase [Anaerolineae bacterium]|nr:adenylosuccinate synthase [Anaerolineae bacterium]